MEEQLLILVNVIIASVLAGLVGWEREKAEKPAGIRTNMIVGAAACLLVSIVDTLIFYVDQSVSENLIRADPIRVIEAIIVGVSFIGGGTILKSDSTNRVKYLTTAATLLFSTGIGITVALNMYVLAVGFSILALFINLVVGWLEDSYLS